MNTCAFCERTFMPEWVGQNRKFCSHECADTSRRKVVSQDFILRMSIPEPNSGCWLWLGCVNDSQYGKVYLRKVAYRAHRLSYEVFNQKEIPPGLIVRHKCDNRYCVNPSHLEIGTRKDNSQDAVDRGRIPHGTQKKNAKLTDELVGIIRRRLKDGEKQQDIAISVGVAQGRISAIALGNSWRHVPQEALPPKATP